MSEQTTPSAPNERHAKSLCTVPWGNFQMDVNGAFRPCCIFKQPSPENEYQFPRLTDHGIGEIWHSDELVRLRRDFRAGKRPADCAACWAEENAGVKSYRQSYNERFGHLVDVSEDRPDAPVSMDLKLSNTCNLKCRICGPMASSTWLREFLDHDLRHVESDDAHHLRTNERYYKQEKIIGQGENERIFVDWLRNVEHIELTGGEPLISRENLKLLELCQQLNVARGIDLLIVTNATHFKPRFLEIFRSFRSVTINFSIDDIEKRFEYERHGASWADSMDVVHSFLTDAPDNVRFNIHCAVSVYNVYYLPEFVDWVETLQPTRRVDLLLHLVHFDPHFCISNLPDEAASVISDRLARAAQGTDDVNVRGQLDSIRRFLDEADPDPSLLARFVTATARRDRIRGESFATTFPELDDALNGRGRTVWQRIRNRLGA